MSGYQRRYANFARARGFSPGQEPLMHEYISWIKAKWAEWKQANSVTRQYLLPEDHAAFDAWLDGVSE